MNRARWFWGIVAAQLFFLTAWAGYHEWLRQTAPTILLQCEPVDPQDLVRGDYMALEYKIGAGKGAETKPGDEVWVLLEPSGRYYAVAQVTVEQPTPRPGQILVRGRAVGNYSRGATMRIDYGIESYFVPEGKGTPRFKTVEVEAAVSAAHRLYIKRVLLDGKAYP